MSHTLTERLNALEKEKDDTLVQLATERNSYFKLNEITVSYWFTMLKREYEKNPSYKKNVIDALVNSVYIYDTPNGTDIDIVLNLNPSERHKITLSDLSKGSTVSNLTDNGAPRRDYPKHFSVICSKYVFVIRATRTVRC